MITLYSHIHSIHNIQYKTYLSIIIDFSIKLFDEISFVGGAQGTVKLKIEKEQRMKLLHTSIQITQTLQISWLRL